MAELIEFVCPKCTKRLMSLHGYKKKCDYCGTDMIETKYTADVIDGMPEEVGDKLIFEEYVKDNPLYDEEETKRTQEKLEEVDRETRLWQAGLLPKKQEKNTPKCPTCGSTNVTKIGAAERGVSIGLFGLFSSKIGKTMKCKNCGYKW